MPPHARDAAVAEAAAAGGAPRPIWRKRLSHRLKEAVHRRPRLDAALDDWLSARAGPLAERLGASTLLRLFPERRVRATPFGDAPAVPTRARALVLTLVPPEDAGGGSRPAQLAVELRRRGFAIDWWWALPIFPWPARRSPAVAGVHARHVSDRVPRRDRDDDRAPADLVLLEAPHPALVDLALRARGDAPIVYDAIDVWDGALGTGWYERAAEDLAIARADRLIGSSALLCSEIAARSGRPVDLVPNAFDPRRFDPAVARPVPVDVRRGRPTVVFVGSLWGEWVDLDLVASLARALPDAEIHLIGPTVGRRLPRARNLHALGPKPQADVPAYLQAADVAIVPFVRDRLAAAVNPLKVYEALAMRRPVVATPLPELVGVPGVALAGDAAEFARAVAAAPARAWPEAEVASFLAGQSWAARAEELLRIAGIRTP